MTLKSILLYLEVYVSNYVIHRLIFCKSLKFSLLGCIESQFRNALIAVITLHMDYGLIKCALIHIYHIHTHIHTYIYIHNHFQIVTFHKFVKF